MPSRIDILEGEGIANAPPSEYGRGPVVLQGVGTQIAFDSEMLSRHLLFIGGIGSGKTNAMFHAVAGVRRHMGPDDVMVVFDTKGDYLAEFRRDGDAVVSSGPEANVGWNVFRDLAAEGDDKRDEAAFEIAQTLFDQRLKASNQPFFPQAASDIVGSCLLAMARSLTKATNADVRSLFDRSGTEDIKALIEPHEDLRGAWHYISNEKSPQTQGVMSEAQQAIRETFVGAFRERGDFSIREFVHLKGGKAVFIEYDIAAGHILEPIYRILLDLAIKEALSRRRSTGHVYFVLDEFSLLPNLSYVENGVNFGRSLGAKFLVGTQNVGQVLEAYSEGRGTSILAGFGTVFGFRLYDAKSREFVRNRHGTNRKRVLVPSVIGSRGMIEEMVYGAVIEDWDLSGLAVGEAVVSLPTGAPFKFKFKEYGG